jgi:hypothetical protein
MKLPPKVFLTPTGQSSTAHCAFIVPERRLNPFAGPFGIAKGNLCRRITTGRAQRSGLKARFDTA